MPSTAVVGMVVEAASVEAAVAASTAVGAAAVFMAVEVVVAFMVEGAVAVASTRAVGVDPEEGLFRHPQPVLELRTR